MKAAELKPAHVGFAVADGVATITLDRPERKNPLTFDSYAELRDLFRGLVQVEDVKAVVITGAGGRGASLSDFADKIGANPASLVQVLLRASARW